MTDGRERILIVPDPSDRRALTAFLTRAVRLDDAAVVRLHRRDDGHVSVWAATGFDALATRTVTGEIEPADLVAGADAVLAGLAVGTGTIDPGFPLDSAWRGALPPATGYEHVDDVPAEVVRDLARDGARLAEQQGRPPASLLDQNVLTVVSDTTTVGVDMRSVFALEAMGFVPTEGDVVRVRASRTWLRLDARYGSVYRRRTGTLELSVSG
ncbi:hypothetical protein DW322_16940 [Rhodococcus rhodnii]|uniref:Uncharacterized protein n=2 Tax=Rhodococcus rhodnii TaxID=38312 RepID=R7WR58_9NOCA|nr:hypothetical protein [Rhodococcus rhodnii]EOM76469.1 hypothetical protein Rrhod_2264 [Rhodococcus rhodnii LMG 5362]TXG91580.1 hypothetical protein DW322_16940 [Rhodococcus rhodnii]